MSKWEEKIDHQKKQNPFFISLDQMEKFKA